jgi:hypothetical protein
MRDFAKVSHCIIKFIEKEELAVGVGVGNNTPSIRYLEHGADIDVQPKVADINSFESCYEQYSKDFKSLLGQEYFQLKDSTKKIGRFKTNS